MKYLKRSAAKKVKAPLGQICSEIDPRSLVEEIKDAGNCLAAELYTATVFHLMRVAEMGLRILAWDRRVILKRKAPIHLQQWGDIFRGLEEAESKIQQYPKTEARESQFEFYHGALVELRAFKNLYRDRTMHVRACYDQYQAQSALVHVSAFMRVLAGKISETKRTPLIWKKV
jgi:hypothetical protein